MIQATERSPDPARTTWVMLDGPAVLESWNAVQETTPHDVRVEKAQFSPERNPEREILESTTTRDRIAGKQITHGKASALERSKHFHSFDG
jgi:hypothetical protein